MINKMDNQSQRDKNPCKSVKSAKLVLWGGFFFCGGNTWLLGAGFMMQDACFFIFGSNKKGESAKIKEYLSIRDEEPMTHITDGTKKKFASPFSIGGEMINRGGE